MIPHGSKHQTIIDTQRFKTSRHQNVKASWPWLIALLLLGLLLSGCTEVRHAKAFDIRSDAQRKNDRSRQKLSQAEDWHELKYDEAQALSPDRIGAKWAILWTGTGSVILLLLAGTGAGAYYLIGFSKAKVRAAHLKAALIPLARDTRQYPLFAYEVRGVMRVYNANTGQLLKLDEGQEPHAQLVAGSGKTQLAGVIAEAGQAHRLPVVVINGQE